MIPLRAKEKSTKVKKPVPPRVWAWVGALGLTVLLLFGPLLDWIRYALKDDLYSYVVMIPGISAYLIWWERRWPPVAGPTLRVGGTSAVFGLIIGLMLGHGMLQPFTGATAQPIDGHAGAMLGFVLSAGAVTLGLLGWQGLRSLLAPWLMLLFMVPFPAATLEAVEMFLQQGSAAVAGWLFQVADTPVLISGLVLKLPGISLQVARECSGIHSTLVLFVTATTASLLFLRSVPARTLLICLVLPLALVRNGFRVFTLGELALKMGPDVLDSWVHHDGGPVFFALSLIPLGLMLWLLRWGENHRTAPPAAAATT